MKHLTVTALMMLCFLACYAQNNVETSPDTVVQREDPLTSALYIYNKEYDVFIKIDITNKNILVPGQEVMGEMVGFLKGNGATQCWLIPSAEVDKANNRILLDMINEYGSEDLVATLTYNTKDSTYTLKQGEGSSLKIGRKSKWVKLPKSLVFTKK